MLPTFQMYRLFYIYIFLRSSISSNKKEHSIHSGSMYCYAICTLQTDLIWECSNPSFSYLIALAIWCWIVFLEKKNTVPYIFYSYCKALSMTVYMIVFIAFLSFILLFVISKNILTEAFSGHICNDITVIDFIISYDHLLKIFFGDG